MSSIVLLFLRRPSMKSEGQRKRQRLERRAIVYGAVSSENGRNSDAPLRRRSVVGGRGRFRAAALAPTTIACVGFSSGTEFHRFGTGNTASTDVYRLLFPVQVTRRIERLLLPCEPLPISTRSFLYGL